MIRLTAGRTALAGALVWAFAQPAAAQPAVPEQTKKINELIAEGWKTAEIKKTAPRADDFEFLRRTYIDLIGRIATPEEVRDFEADRSAGKRVKLINRLLYESKYLTKNGGKVALPPGVDASGFDYTAEYAEHWSNLWTVWLMSRTGNEIYREQMRNWLQIEFYVNPTINHKEMVTKILTATGKSDDNGAVNFIIHHLGDPVPPDERGKYGKFDAVPITSRVTRLFLGLQTQCTQCHDHPHNKEWVQSDFWEVNAFFRQTERSATPSPAQLRNNMVANKSITVSDTPDLNPTGLVLYERRDGRRMAAKPVFLKDLAQAESGEQSDKRVSSTALSGGGKTRRQMLAEYVVSHDNFGRAYVNRVWGHLFGRGLNKDSTLDDFGSHNPMVHQELLDYLAGEFAKYQYDPKKLLEWICASDVYQLGHVCPKEYTDPKFDPYFPKMPLKAMSPEVLFDSLATATKAEAKGDAKKQQRDEWMRKLVRNFGDDEGNELSFNGTVVQALLMMNGKELNDEVAGTGTGRRPAGAAVSRDNVVAGVFAKTKGAPLATYNELFLMALNRYPTSAEVASLEQVRTGKASISIGGGPAPAPKGPAPKGPAPKGPAAKGPVRAPVAGALSPYDVTYFQDVFWALLNTNEFMLNH